MTPGPVLGFIMDLLGLRPDPYPDGFGQTLIEDCRYYLRSRGCRNMQIEWRRPLPEDHATWDMHPVVGRLRTISWHSPMSTVAPGS